MNDKQNQSTNHDSKKISKWFEINSYMLPAKITYFLNNARYCIGDFLILFYVQSGLSPFEAGLVNGLQHIGGMIAAPLFGLIADKYGFHRLIAICLCVAATLAICIQPYITSTLGKDKSCPLVNSSNINYLDRTPPGAPLMVESHLRAERELFLSLLSVAFLASAFDGSLMSFNDVGVLTRIQNSASESNIGVQRMTAALGSSLGSLSYSFSIRYFPHGNLSCNVGLFITYAVFAACLGIGFFFLFRGLSIKKKEKQQKNVTSLVLKHIKNVRTCVFLLNVLFNGTIPALVFSYLFLFLKEELNASPLLLGASISFNSFSGIVLYSFADKLIAFLGGPMNAMCASTFAWGFRLLALGYLMNPYHILLIDLFHGFTFSVFKVSCLAYLNEETDASIFGSMCGIVNALSYSCSFLLANIVGGKLYELYGPRNLFFGIAVASFCWSFLLMLYIVSLKNKQYTAVKQDDEDEEDT